MKKTKPTLKQYLNSYQNKKLNKSASGDLQFGANSHQFQLSRIQDKIQNIKATLKDKVNAQIYETVCGDLNEVKCMERAIFMQKMEANLGGESGHRSSLQRSSILKSCLGQRSSRNSKNFKFDTNKQNLQSPPILNHNTLRIDTNDRVGKAFEQSQVFVREEGLFEELNSIKEYISSERMERKAQFIVPPQLPNFGTQRPSINNYLVVEESQTYEQDD